MVGAGLGLQQFAELLDGQTSLSYDCSHCHRFDWIVPRDVHSHSSVAHRDVLTLFSNPISRFFEGADGSQVIDGRYDRHILDDGFDFFRLSLFNTR